MLILNSLPFCIGPHCLSKKRPSPSLIGHNELLFSSDEDPYQGKWTNCWGWGVFGPAKLCDTLAVEVGGERKLLFLDIYHILDAVPGLFNVLSPG